MKIRSRWLNWLLAASVVLVCRALFRTLRIHYLAATGNTNPYTNDGSEGFIYCVWHDAIAFPMFAGRHVRTVALVSQNIDGSHLAFGLKMLNIGLVRGSSSRGGANAMRELLKLPVTTHVVVTPDGPRGPSRQIKQGVVFLASHSGRAIVPTAFSAVRFWKIPGRWTELMIPKPFTTVYALSGPPIHIVAEADSQQMDIVQLRVQSEMERLSVAANRLACRA
ncbi:MAG TPA: lysophospholipid acyltransferase family protein [Pirellulales bacterium]|nr:lysophospholipid acyltransferase family protein [Pirellulales bacterium]